MAMSPEYAREYRAKNKDKQSVNARANYLRRRSENPYLTWAKSALLAAKYRARDKGLPFSITVEDIVCPDYCPALDIPISYLNDKLEDNSPNLDRIKPELGYVPGNIQVLSSLANRIKTNARWDQVRKVADFMERNEI